MKQGLNGKPTKVTANLSHFIQHKVNFVENILYGESAPTEEYPIVRIPGGSYPRRKKQYPWFERCLGQKKTEGGRLIYYLWRSWRNLRIWNGRHKTYQRKTRRGELGGWPKEPRAYPNQQSVISTKKKERKMIILVGFLATSSPVRAVEG